MNHKFRGFDAVGDKGWVYGDLVHNIKITKERDLPRVMVGGYEVIPESVGLCSELTDKNGKEIFEGDIVRHPFVDPIFRDLVVSNNGKGVLSEVVFHNGAFTIKNDENDYIYLDAFTRHNYIEVVGNIIENKELLEERYG